MKKTPALFACALLLFIFSCTKGKGTGYETYYGSFSAELLALPGAATLDVYVNDTKIDSLQAGKFIGIASPLRLIAGVPATISFRKAGTDLLILDTTITVTPGEKPALKIAYSLILGIQDFTSGNSNVSTDSTSFFLFNGLPEAMISDDIIIEAYLFKANQDGSHSATGITWSNLERNKLNPNMVTIRSLPNEDGTTNSYVIKLKNTATGEFIRDGFGRDYIAPYFEAGSREIITLSAAQLFGLYLFQAQYATY
ncbi:MAG: hypothetical protein P0Y53_11965 [Candidatus Pseudobacter hemicellulosilyticus]|uniref:DUF4843 domain-containing protein n=1 Tax=Candidatus Pseudobacter hemicellulosilyticus TaxID=3121375 RepID=A0AAJ5WX86_9BACT|nr:MAG: hypothetical protein P0Y53_11965 [Pseudobacter sp.]